MIATTPSGPTPLERVYEAAQIAAGCHAALATLHASLSPKFSDPVHRQLFMGTKATLQLLTDELLAIAEDVERPEVTAP